MTDLFLVAMASAYSLLAFAGLIILVIRVRTLFYDGAPFVASSKDSIRRALELAAIMPSDRFVDIGSGDGSVVFAALDAGATHTDGFEIDPLLIRRARMRSIKKGYGMRATFHHKNFWEADLSPYDVVFLFQIPYAMPRLEEKLLKELKPGARVISNTFKFPNWSIERSSGALRLYIRK